MPLATNLIRIEGDTTHYPSTPMKRCTMLGSDNVRYEADLLPSETDILIYFLSLKSKLSDKEISRLSDMIEKYGDDRAEVAVTNEYID